MERHYDNNPWADKLSQVSLPDKDGAWKEMSLLLDKEMPVGRKRDKRRWFLLILLLLLLIGVCNCPGRDAGGKFPVATMKQGGGDGIPVPGGRGADGKDREIKGVNGGTGEKDRDIVEKGRDYGTGERDGSTGERGRSLDGKNQRRGGNDRETGGEKNVGSRSRMHKVARRTKTDKTFGDTIIKKEQTDRLSGDRAPREDSPVGKAGLPGKDRSPGKNVSPGKDSLPGEYNLAGKDSTLLIKKAAVKKDSVHKAPAKPAPKPAEEKKQKEGGWWTVGIGLNQFFMVGGQQASHYNSGGISGTLGDYIPVPVIRYHFNRKFYLQLEAQLNSPQYTRKDLVLSRPPLDSVSPTQVRQNSVFIKKLFYFNIPFSVHYNVFRTLDIGTGLQFSRLSNGIGLFQDQLIDRGGGGIDSSSALSKSFKGDTLYKKIKTNEFRVLLDASYTWKSFIFGIRYNQSLSKFINIQVAPGQVTQARNSSLQLYLRYILWDNRKKPLPMTK